MPLTPLPLSPDWGEGRVFPFLITTLFQGEHKPRVCHQFVAGQNQSEIFLHRRPSRSINSSASLGPQVPEA